MPEIRVARGGENDDLRVVSVTGDDGIWLSFAIPKSAVAEVAEALIAEAQEPTEPEEAEGDA